VHSLPLLPFYIFYSMFGFQRVGDLIWAAADQRARGFLIGATSGRTTLGGESLQHQDGTSHVIAATVPSCRAYDPASSGELAVILDQGARQMVEEGQDVFYYITVMNENYSQPDLPSEQHEAIIKGMYLFSENRCDTYAGSVQLLGSGAIIREVIAAGELLVTDWQIANTVWSVTSFSELARDARETTRHNRLHPNAPRRTSHLATCLKDTAPIIAATDYVAAYPQLISAYLPQRFVALGTDGFGRSDTRSTLRRFFEVDRHHIVVAALHALSEGGSISRSVVSAAISRYGIDSNRPPPWMQ
jgi:pyruvate dehydrogenase E1 component